VQMNNTPRSKSDRVWAETQALDLQFFRIDIHFDTALGNGGRGETVGDLDRCIIFVY
jgi:hypothetical protein